MNAANEAKFINARQRKNVIAHAKTIGYKLNHITSSTAVVTFRKSPAHTEDILIPRHLTLKTNDPPISFVVTRDVTWAAGETETEVPVKQGILSSESFSGTGLGNQVLSLLDRKVGQNSVVLAVDGIEWEEVDNFVASDSADEHYQVDTNATDVTRITFGDGLFGKAPPAGSSISVKYLKSDGDSGNIGAGKITIIGGVLLDTLADPVSGVSASNDNKSPEVTGTVAEPFAPAAGVSDTLQVIITKNGVRGDVQEFVLDPADTTAALVAARIMLTAENFTAEDSSGSLRLIMSETGPSQKIEILEVASNAYTVLGLTKGLTSGVSGAATGGTEKESIERAKRQAPAVLQALDRAVTRFDYMALVNAWPGVAKSQVWGEQEENPPNYDMFNRIKVVFVPEGGGFPSVTLKDEVLAMLEARKVMTTKITMIDPDFVDVTISATVYLNGGYEAATVKAEVVDSLNQLLNESELEFEEDLRYANVVRLIDTVLGVHHCHVRVNGDVDDIAVGRGQMARKLLFSITTVARSAWTL